MVVGSGLLPAKGGGRGGGKGGGEGGGGPPHSALSDTFIQPLR